MAKNETAQEVAEPTADQPVDAPAEDAPVDVAPLTEVFLTVDVDGGWWWATRDDTGELTQSDGPSADRQYAEERAKAVLETDQLVFSVEEDDRGSAAQ